ncbi:MAG TPA: hypothetical protein DEA61_05040 [Caldanaerobacter subterraneus]|uniref:Uncharacterized protein n=2 Tax=Caldanaerobacter subterraneus TaxID=911092 RepID=Q8R995_CALS4|nr:hypothetical protein TTE1722 [Caldanaerobacter subterraneus subsp. tengcongensis MB4]HBT49187.1 hypothetical protein [Caldanaerobacter subterraneus]
MLYFTVYSLSTPTFIIEPVKLSTKLILYEILPSLSEKGENLYIFFVKIFFVKNFLLNLTLKWLYLGIS